MNEIFEIILGIGLFFGGLSRWASTTKLLKNGKSAEGAIVGFGDSEMIDSQAQYPIIRFLTADNVWITEKYNAGGLPGITKMGQKVSVLYNPENPKEFIVRLRAAPYVSWIIMVVALIILGIGIFRLLQV